jgi:peptide/nickel transport system substrate-binding protein
MMEEKMKAKKYISILLAVVMLLACLAGCGSKEAAGKDAGKDTGKRDDIIVSINAEPTTLCPFNSPQVAANLVCRQMFEALVKTDRSGKVFYPGIASEWTVSDDATTVDLTIRNDIKFHNGETLTVDDVVFSYDECMRLGVCETELALYDHMEKVDDSHVRLILKHPFANIMTAIGSIDLCIVSKKAYEADPDAFYRNPVGCGPYKFVEWKSGESISMTRFDDYYDKAPAIKDVTFKIIQDDSAASMALQNGEIDLTSTPPAADHDRIEPPRT